MGKAYHFDHKFDEVYKIVGDHIPELNSRDRRAVADVAYAYGQEHRNSGMYEDFRNIVGVSLPQRVRPSRLQPVFTQLFDYTPKGEKRDRPKSKTNGHTIRPQHNLIRPQPILALRSRTIRSRLEN